MCSKMPDLVKLVDHLECCRTGMAKEGNHDAKLFIKIVEKPEGGEAGDEDAEGGSPRYMGTYSPRGYRQQELYGRCHLSAGK